jgi:hypothetical protein
MTTEQIALGAAAAGLLFWPQLSAMLKTATAKGGAQALLGGPVVEHQAAGLDRPAAVLDLLRLQTQMKEAGLVSASDLAGRLVVELVSGGKNPASPPEPAARARR